MNEKDIDNTRMEIRDIQRALDAASLYLRSAKKNPDMAMAAKAMIQKAGDLFSRMSTRFLMRSQ